MVGDDFNIGRAARQRAYEIVTATSKSPFVNAT